MQDSYLSRGFNAQAPLTADQATFAPGCDPKVGGCSATINVIKPAVDGSTGKPKPVVPGNVIFVKWIGSDSVKPTQPESDRERKLC
jgi:hypothetical protein